AGHSWLLHPRERSGARARVVQVAGYPTLRFDFFQDWNVNRTAWHHPRAPGMEHAARRWCEERGRQSRDAAEILFCLEIRQTVDQQLGVRVHGIFEDVPYWPVLH